MRKTLLSLFALALSLGANAQNEATTSQRIVGYYTTDDYDETYGTGLPNYGENDNCKAVIDLIPEILSHYDGAKVVAIRFALSQPLEKSRVFLASVTDDGNVGEDIVSEDVDAPGKGWTTVKLTKPYTISKDKEFVAGYAFKQKSIVDPDPDNLGGYTEECYPISCAYYGRNDLPLLIYCNIPESEGGKGEKWYNFGSKNGNLSVQLIVEGNFVDYDLTPSDFEPITVAAGTPTEKVFEVFNNSKGEVSDYSYRLTVDGVAQSEHGSSFLEPLASGQRDFIGVEIPAFEEAGTHDIALEITKVDNKDNQAVKKTVTGQVIVGTSGINGVSSKNNATEVSRYTIDGVKLSAPQKDLNIVKMSDGSTVKVMVK